ncbi:MAG: hypothetical protein KJ749_13310 [Planctomycetes bacterium]|nr:hypothetical protein [Planctomycetota bacterium]
MLLWPPADLPSLTYYVSSDLLANNLAAVAGLDKLKLPPPAFRVRGQC